MIVSILLILEARTRLAFFFPLTNWNHFNDTSALINSRSTYKGKVSHQTLKIFFVLSSQTLECLISVFILLRLC